METPTPADIADPEEPGIDEKTLFLNHLAKRFVEPKDSSSFQCFLCNSSKILQLSPPATSGRKQKKVVYPPVYPKWKESWAGALCYLFGMELDGVQEELVSCLLDGIWCENCIGLVLEVEFVINNIQALQNKLESLKTRTKSLMMIAAEEEAVIIKVEDEESQYGEEAPEPEESEIFGDLELEMGMKILDESEPKPDVLVPEPKLDVLEPEPESDLQEPEPDPPMSPPDLIFPNNLFNFIQSQNPSTFLRSISPEPLPPPPKKQGRISRRWTLSKPRKSPRFVLPKIKSSKVVAPPPPAPQKKKKSKKGTKRSIRSKMKKLRIAKEAKKALALEQGKSGCSCCTCTKKLIDPEPAEPKPQKIVPTKPKSTKFCTKHKKPRNRNPPPGQFSCQLCTKTFLTQRSLKTHNELYHYAHAPNSNYLKCSFCLKIFSKSTEDENNLLIHENLHRSVGHTSPWTCVLCPDEPSGTGTIFQRQSELQKHVLQAHESEEHIFRCPEPNCEVVVLTKSRLRGHLGTHRQRKSRRHLCSICGALSAGSTQLRRHMESHDDLKLTCNVPGCEGLSYKNPHTLQRHQKYKHPDPSAPPPPLFTCQVCNKGFTDKPHLDRHSVYHLDLRPFLCDQCPATFQLRKNLLNHLAVHKINNDKGREYKFIPRKKRLVTISGVGVEVGPTGTETDMGGTGAGDGTGEPQPGEESD